MCKKIFFLILIYSLILSACGDGSDSNQAQAGEAQAGEAQAGEAPALGGMMNEGGMNGGENSNMQEAGMQEAGMQEAGMQEAGMQEAGMQEGGTNIPEAGSMMDPDMSVVDHCMDQPCQNGGICLNLVDSFTCECRQGFHGEICADRVPRFVAFSGGGWHSHSALAGWIAGLLDGTDSDLALSFTHVHGISANSGGGWFMSMLAYSTTFLEGLENGRDDYVTTGYLGQVTQLFDGALNDDPCSGWSDLLNSVVAGEMAELMCNARPDLQGHFGVYKVNRDEEGDVHLNWHRLVHQIVYAPLGLEAELSGLTLSSPHLPWASDKSLMYASTLLTNQVMLAYEEDAYLYWGIYAGITGADGLPNQKSVTPVVFTSLGNSSDHAQASLSAAPLTLVHSEVDVDPVSTIVSQLDTSNVSILDSSIASSAALGFGASYGILEDLSPISTGLMTASWFLSGLAPPADILGDQLVFREDGRIYNDDGEVGYQTFDALAQNKTVRFADGGYIDNAAVTTLVKHIQENQYPNFELLSFMNSTSPEVQLGEFSIPSSIQVLFANPNELPEPGIMSTCSSPDQCLLTPSNHVFTPESWDQAELLWSYEESEIQLRYFRVPVETQQNDTFGIEAGLTGIMHLFVHTTNLTSALPINQDQLNAYQDVYRVTRAGISTHGGGMWLKEALGLE